MLNETTKSERFNPRFDPETREMLRDLAEVYLESQSAVLRQLVREAWQRLPKEERNRASQSRRRAS